MTSTNLEQRLHVGHYSSRQQILFVGEGNFAFSSLLATAFGLAPNVCATSIDSHDVFCARYGADGVANVKNLRARGAQVYFGVDITTAASETSNSNLLFKKFDVVIFNYPHAGYLHDSLSLSSRLYAGFYYTLHHQELIRNFFENVTQTLLKSGGEIHITHKTTVHKRWKFNRSATQSGLFLKKSLLFLPESFPGYVPCRGAGKNWITTFPLGKGSKTYIYGWMDLSSQLNDLQAQLLNI